VVVTVITSEDLIENAESYDSNKYTEEFYSYYLSVIQNENDIESLSEAIKRLFLWKLGKIRPYPTPQSSPIEVPPSFEKQYHAISTTSSNRNAIVKAIEADTIKSAISFRDGDLSYDDFKSKVFGITSSSIVLPSFYIHIMQPERYPILDKKVWKVFCKEKTQSIYKHKKPKNWVDYEIYICFFNEIVEKTNLNWRTVDCGLWVMGSELDENVECSDMKTTKKEIGSELTEENTIINSSIHIIYRGRNIQSYKLAASKVVPNIKMEKLTEILVGIYGIWQENEINKGFIKYDDCKHLCSTVYRD